MWNFPTDWTIALCVLGLLQILDVATTIRVLDNGGYETNPIVAWMMDRLGDYGWIVVKLAIAAIGALLIYRSGQIWPLWAMCAVYAFVVYRNYKIVG